MLKEKQNYEQIKRQLNFLYRSEMVPKLSGIHKSIRELDFVMVAYPVSLNTLTAMMLAPYGFGQVCLFH